MPFHLLSFVVGRREQEQRAHVLSRQLDMPDVERSLRDAIVSVEKEIESSNFKIDNVASDEANLDAKIEKKKAELERHQKRLQALKAVRCDFLFLLPLLLLFLARRGVRDSRMQSVRSL